MTPMSLRGRDIHPTDEDLSEGTPDMGDPEGRVMPSLQDGRTFWDAHSPGFTRGYSHALPLGAKNGEDGDCAIQCSIESHVPEGEGHPPHGRRPVRGDPGLGGPGGNAVSPRGRDMGTRRSNVQLTPMSPRGRDLGDPAIQCSIESHVPECEGHPPHGRRPVRGDPGQGGPGFVVLAALCCCHADRRKQY